MQDVHDGHWLIGELRVVHAAGEATEGRMALVEHRAAEGADVPWHRQPADDEAFHVLDGELEFWLGDRDGAPRVARAGDTVVVPRGLPHAFRVRSASARYLSVHTPAGHERFLRAAGRPAERLELPPSGPPDLPRLESAYAAHGVEILGPPPSGG